ncbi:hypothetical protein CsatB_026905 [Cannabis sativa]
MCFWRFWLGRRLNRHLLFIYLVQEFQNRGFGLDLICLVEEFRNLGFGLDLIVWFVFCLQYLVLISNPKFLSSWKILDLFRFNGCIKQILYSL